MIDYHVHLVDHGESRVFSTEDVRAYARAGAAAGLTEIAITEHLYRFPDVQDAFGDWWKDDPNPTLRDHTRRELAAERFEQSLGDYAAIVSDAAAQVDPRGGESRVLVGLEVDLIPGRMTEVVDMLGRHEWDVLLGSVHWLGAWGFDNLDDAEPSAEWEARDPDEVWLAYVAAVEEMAASGACDVLAHLDLVKIAGVWPVRAGRECEERLVKAATSNDLAIEINANGLRKPAADAYPGPALLAALASAGVGLTLASDAHSAARVGDANAALARRAVDAGFTHLTRFEGRRASLVPIAPAAEID